MICNVSQYRGWRNENLYCIPPGVLDEGVSFVQEGFIRLNKFLDSLESKCKPRLKILGRWLRCKIPHTSQWDLRAICIDSERLAVF